jgi:hypothetical protein
MSVAEAALAVILIRRSLNRRRLFCWGSVRAFGGHGFQIAIGAIRKRADAHTSLADAFYRFSVGPSALKLLN